MSANHFCNELTGPDSEMTINKGVVGFKRVLEGGVDFEIDTDDFEGGDKN